MPARRILPHRRKVQRGAARLGTVVVPRWRGTLLAPAQLRDWRSTEEDVRQAFQGLLHARPSGIV